MKKRIALLLSLLFLLASCMHPTPDLPNTETATHTETTAEETTTSQSLAPQSPYPVPLWTNEADTAAAFLEYDGCVVDSSKREYSYTEMVGDLKELHTHYPERFSFYSIGTSVAGRTIYTAVLGNPDAPKQILVSAGIHGREYLTPILAMKQMEFYLAYYDQGSYQGVPYTTLFEDFCFYVVPMSNPDGIMLSQAGIESLEDPLLQETVRSIHQSELANQLTNYQNVNNYLRFWKSNVRGVDLNRNYPARWETYQGFDIPASYDHKGPAPASEPETVALMKLTESLSNICAVLCIHSQGEVLYWNCGQTGELYETTTALVYAIADRTGYKPDKKLVHDASFSDWCALEKHLIAITVEVGLGTCPLFIDKFPTIWTDNFDLLPLTVAHFNE